MVHTFTQCVPHFWVFLHEVEPKKYWDQSLNKKTKTIKNKKTTLKIINKQTESYKKNNK